MICQSTLLILPGCYWQQRRFVPCTGVGAWLVVCVVGVAAVRRGCSRGFENSGMGCWGGWGLFCLGIGFCNLCVSIGGINVGLWLRYEYLYWGMLLNHVVGGKGRFSEEFVYLGESGGVKLSLLSLDLALLPQNCVSSS